MARRRLKSPLIPAQAGIRRRVPAFAGTSGTARALAIAVTAAVLCLAGCGRKGDLELLPGPATQPPVAAAPVAPSSFLPSSRGTLTQQQQDAAAVKNGFDAQGNPVATPGERKPFLLDPLLR